MLQYKYKLDMISVIKNYFTTAEDFSVVHLEGSHEVALALASKEYEKHVSDFGKEIKRINREKRFRRYLPYHEPSKKNAR